MRDKPDILISPDIDVLYEDADQCCDNAYGDSISNDSPWLGPCFHFVVPGIEEWLHRYEMATDFADTVTDPSFDWKTWHYEGLCFAKAIWERLPRFYSLYYRPPYEDRSGTVTEVKIDEKIDGLIDRLRRVAGKDIAPISFKDRIEYAVTKVNEGVKVEFRINRLALKITFPYNRLSGARHWLEDIINPQEAVCTLQLSRYNLYFARQTVGSHPEMGRFWITEDLQCNDKFSAYVDAQEFVRELLAIFDGIGEEV